MSSRYLHQQEAFFAALAAKAGRLQIEIGMCCLTGHTFSRGANEPAEQAYSITNYSFNYIGYIDTATKSNRVLCAHTR